MVKKEIEDDWDIVFEYWENNQISCAYECVKIFTSKYPENINGWIVKADILTKFARYSEAEKVLNKALSIESDKYKSSVYSQFGHLYKKTGDVSKAKKYYHKSIAIKETNEVYNFLGSCFSREGDFHKAKYYFKKAIGISDCNPDESYFNLGLIARAEGLYKEAKSYFEKAIKKDLDYIDAKEALEDVNNTIEMLKKKFKLFRLG